MGGLSSDVPEDEILDSEVEGAEEDDDVISSGIAESHKVTIEEAGRADKVLAQALPGLSRARIQSLIAEGQVFLGDVVMRDASKKLKSGDLVRIEVPEPTSAIPQAENIPLDIVYEDQDILVVNKPVGMVVHPAPGAYSGTLVNALLHHCRDSLSGIGGVLRPGIVQRLDKDTSGLMVIAKNDEAHQFLSAQLSERTLSRVYHALVWGIPLPLKGRIKTQIARHPRERQRMAVRRMGGKEAVTDYRVLSHPAEGVSLVECRLQTGRTHQIRVHMSHIGHPIVGDSVYGKKSNNKPKGISAEDWELWKNFPRQALHAKDIGFVHPKSLEFMEFSSDYPEDIQALIRDYSV